MLETDTQLSKTACHFQFQICVHHAAFLKMEFNEMCFFSFCCNCSHLQGELELM